MSGGRGWRRLGASLPAAVTLPGMGLRAQRDQAPALQQLTGLWAGQAELRLLLWLSEQCPGVLYQTDSSQVAAWGPRQRSLR